MPSPPPSSSEGDFETIIAEQLVKLQRELVEQCECHVQEREQHLLHTIEELRREIRILREGGEAALNASQAPTLPGPLQNRADIDEPCRQLPAATGQLSPCKEKEGAGVVVGQATACKAIGNSVMSSQQEEGTAEFIKDDRPLRASVRSTSAGSVRSSALSVRLSRIEATDHTLTLVERPRSFKEGIWEEWQQDASGAASYTSAEKFYLSAESHFKSIDTRMRSMSVHAARASEISESSAQSALSRQSFLARGCACIWSRIGILSPASHVRLCWDILGIPVLFYDLVAIPLGVYDIPENFVTNLVFWIILVYWTLDILMTTCTGYFNKSGVLVMDPYSIAKHYVLGSFWLDFGIILGDWIPIFLSAVGIGAGAGASSLRILRIFRTARFMRLLRLRRLKDFVAAIEDYIDSAYTSVCLGIIMKILGIIAINHFLGCAWFGVGSMEFPSYRSWVDAHGYDDKHWTYQYLTSLHWAITQFTPGGTNIQCHNPMERIFNVATLLFALVVFSSFVSSLTQARLELQALTSKYSKECWMMRRYLRQRQVNRELYLRICAYVNAKVVARSDVLDGSGIVLLQKLSHPLMMDLQVEVFGRHVMKHPFFQRLSAVSYRTMTQLCNDVLSIVSLGHGDLLFREGCLCQAMYFLIEGRMMYFFNYSPDVMLKLASGEWCCEAILWTKWVHAGSMGCEEVATLVDVDHCAFREVIVADPVAKSFAIHYAERFIDMISGQESSIGPKGLHDLHAHISIDVETMK